MKILFIIHCSGLGVGGHYHSLYHVSFVLSKIFDVYLITIGKNKSPVIKEHPKFYKHIYCVKSFRSIYKANNKFSKINKELNVDIIHFFDSQSFNFLMLNKYVFKLKVALSKCGGPNSIHSNWQHADAIFNQSLENHLWFKNNINYKNELLFHIPNRVAKFEFDNLNRFGPRLEGCFTFLRVSRIGRRYEKTFYDSCNLIKLLKDSFNVRFVLIGKVQEEDVFIKMKRFVSMNSLPVEFITDDRASDGKQALYLADAVIGTGRSLMEALSKSIPILTPLTNKKMPVLVTEDNFQSFLSTNFSERNDIRNYDEAGELSNIFKLVTDKQFYETISLQMSRLFDCELGEKGIIDKYSKAYNELILNKRNFKKFYFPNLFYSFRYSFF
ncbi:MAG: hypothetical protein ACXIT9_12450 [Nitritalea sp.]